MLAEKPWKLDKLLVLLLGLLVSVSLGGILIHGLEMWSLSSGNIKILMFIVGTISFHGAALYLINSFLREHQIGWAEAFGLNSPNLGRALSLAALVGLIVLPISWSLSYLSMKVMEAAGVKVEVQQAIQTLQTTESGFQRVYFGLVAIVIAPIVEELVFRGIIYPTIKQTGYRNLALWGTSFLFAASHVNLMTFAPLTCLAIVLTLLYESTNNLLAPILTHSLFNAANFFWLMTDLSRTS